MKSNTLYHREFSKHMTNSRLVTWLGNVSPAAESFTPPTRCPVVKLDYSKPLPKPKKGRTLSDFVESWTADEENRKDLNDAKIWLGEEFSREGDTIRSLRLKRGLSQAQLAQIMETQQSHIARIEKGRDSITLETLFKLEAALGVDCNTLAEAIRLQQRLASDGTGR